MKNEKGITLITLIVTIIVMLILITSVTINLGPYKNEVVRTSFEEDINSLREEVEHYYAINKTLPVINRYGYTDMFESIKNVNDNDKYYVIDIRKIDVDLKIGKDFYRALARDIDDEIFDLLDIYIINEQSHTIYYPKGIDYNGVVLYTLIEQYSNVKDKAEDNRPPIVKITLAKSDKLFGITSTIEISDDFSGVDLSSCKYIFTKSAEELGTNIKTYSQAKSIYNLNTSIEQAMGPSNNWYLHVLATDKAGNKVEVISENSIKIDATAEFTYTGDAQTANMLPGKYQMECWGAQGGVRSENNANYGAYTYGIINLIKDVDLYVYVGEKGDLIRTIKFNGGGIGGFTSTSNDKNIGASGGGATDFRTIRNLWDNFSSLASRIMVAAGSGGATVDFYESAGEKSAAGGLEGYSGGYYSGHQYVGQEGGGATQVLGGRAGINHYSATGNVNSGKLGIGGDCESTSSGEGAGGGGGGYYGGGAGGSTLNGGRGQGAGGGSSFISGHTGCDAIAETSTEDNIVHTGQSKHYSGYVFTNTKMIDGAGYNCTIVNGEEVKVQEQMPNPKGGKYALGEGHTGDGYARITNLN